MNACGDRVCTKIGRVKKIEQIFFCFFFLVNEEIQRGKIQNNKFFFLRILKIILSLSILYLSMESKAKKSMHDEEISVTQIQIQK